MQGAVRQNRKVGGEVLLWQSGSQSSTRARRTWPGWQCRGVARGDVARVRTGGWCAVGLHAPASGRARVFEGNKGGDGARGAAGRACESGARAGPAPGGGGHCVSGARPLTHRRWRWPCFVVWFVEKNAEGGGTREMDRCCRCKVRGAGGAAGVKGAWLACTAGGEYDTFAGRDGTCVEGTVGRGGMVRCRRGRCMVGVT